MSVTKETIDNIVNAYFEQPNRSLISIIFSDYGKNLTIEELENVYEILKKK